MRYLHYRELQDYMKMYFQKTGQTLSFATALKRMDQENKVHDGPIPTVDFSLCNLNDNEEICHYIDQIAIPIDADSKELESNRSLQNSLIVFKYPSYSRAGVHIQDGIELNYVYSGTCTLYFEGNTYTIHEDEIVIIPPDTHHDVLDTEDSIVFSFLVHQDFFNETFFQVIHKDTPLSTFYDLCLYHYAKVFLLFRISQPRKFLSTFLSLYSEFASGDAYSYDICINYIRILFAYLLRQPNWDFRNEFQNEAHSVVNNIPVILNFIKYNYKTISLNYLADYFHYDRSHLGKLIKKYTNSSFSDLVTSYRLNHAVYLLLDSNMGMEEIAEETGYQSADHFSRMFKRKFGITPSSYRKENSAYR